MIIADPGDAVVMTNQPTDFFFFVGIASDGAIGDAHAVTSCHFGQIVIFAIRRCDPGTAYQLIAAPALNGTRRRNDG